MQFAELFPDVMLAIRGADITGAKRLMEERERDRGRRGSVRLRPSRSGRNAKPLI